MRKKYKKRAKPVFLYFSCNNLQCRICILQKFSIGTPIFPQITPLLAFTPTSAYFPERTVFATSFCLIFFSQNRFHHRNFLFLLHCAPQHCRNSIHPKHKNHTDTRFHLPLQQTAYYNSPTSHTGLAHGQSALTKYYQKAKYFYILLFYNLLAINHTVSYKILHIRPVSIDTLSYNAILQDTVYIAHRKNLDFLKMNKTPLHAWIISV